MSRVDQDEARYFLRVVAREELHVQSAQRVAYKNIGWLDVLAYELGAKLGHDRCGIAWRV